MRYLVPLLLLVALMLSACTVPTAPQAGTPTVGEEVEIGVTETADVEATGTPAAAEETPGVMETPEMTGTVEITETPEMTDEMTGTPEMEMTAEATGTPELTMTVEATGTPEMEMTPEITATAEMTEAGEGNRVEVSLVEYEIEMPASIPTGPTTFEVTNDGDEEHNFEIEGQGIEEVFEENLQPGETRTMEVDLEPGEYTVYCPVGDHREQGMELTLTVTAE